MLVVSDCGQQMRPGHRHLDRLTGEFRHRFEFLDKAKIGGVADRSATGGCRMGDIRIVIGNRLRARHALERRNLLPKMVEHRVGRRMPVVRSPVHLAAGDDVDAGDLLFEDRGLHRAILRVGDIGRLKLIQGDQAVERLVPPRHAVSADHRRRVFRIERHSGGLSPAHRGAKIPPCRKTPLDPRRRSVPTGEH
jgi:hypothetical protein